MSLGAWLDELEGRNEDNVTRTAAYLELYAWTVRNPPELPWVLMAHLVSRNAGYLMTDLARAMERNAAIEGFALGATNLFEFLERANWLIFWDAWHHVLTWRLHGASALQDSRTTAWVRGAWARFDVAPDERRLVLDLVINEQNLIERRVVHHDRFGPARMMLAAIDGAGREKPISLPGSEAHILVGDFRVLERRIEAGRRLYDEALVDPEGRRRLFDWACAHPHTGSREVIGGRPGPGLRDVWPVQRHAWPAPDPLFP